MSNYWTNLALSAEPGKKADEKMANVGASALELSNPEGINQYTKNGGSGKDHEIAKASELAWEATKSAHSEAEHDVAEKLHDTAEAANATLRKEAEDKGDAKGVAFYRQQQRLHATQAAQHHAYGSHGTAGTKASVAAEKMSAAADRVTLEAGKHGRRDVDVSEIPLARESGTAHMYAKAASLAAAEGDSAEAAMNHALAEEKHYQNSRAARELALKAGRNSLGNSQAKWEEAARQQYEASQGHHSAWEAHGGINAGKKSNVPKAAAKNKLRFSHNVKLELAGNPNHDERGRFAAAASDKANEAGKKADKLADKARTTGKPEDNEAARKGAQAARDAHTAAAEAHEKNRDPGAAGIHRNEATKYNILSEHEASSTSGLKSKSNDEYKGSFIDPHMNSERASQEIASKLNNKVWVDRAREMIGHVTTTRDNVTTVSDLKVHPDWPTKGAITFKRDSDGAQFSLKLVGKKFVAEQVKKSNTKKLSMSTNELGATHKKLNELAVELSLTSSDTTLKASNEELASECECGASIKNKKKGICTKCGAKWPKAKELSLAGNPYHDEHGKFTSGEGDNKKGEGREGHYEKKANKAIQAEGEYNRAHAKAEKSGKAEDHKAAAVAAKKLGDTHWSAAKAANNVGEGKVGKVHRQQVVKAEEQQKYHENKASLLGAKKGLQKLNIGDRVKVTDAGGVNRGREGTIIHPSKVPTDGRGIPQVGEGHYKPIDWKQEYAVQDDKGKIFTMYKNRLQKSDASPLVTDAERHGDKVQQQAKVLEEIKSRGLSQDARDAARKATDKADYSNKPEDHKAAWKANQHAADVTNDPYVANSFRKKAKEHANRAEGQNRYN